MNVGKRIKAARQALGLSQSDLAGMTDVSQPTVANWEKGSHAPRHAALSKIAGALESTPAALLDAGAPGGGSALSQHHVPIIARPLSAPDIDSGAVIGYMTASCEAARPFAFIAVNDHPHLNLTRGDTLIFDRAPAPATRKSVTLGFDEAGPVLQNAETKKDAADAPRLIMSVSRY